MKNTIERAMALRSLQQTAQPIKLSVNGLARVVSATADTPLLYVLHDDFHLSGPRYGCGLAQCGACTVHLDGQPIRSCVTPVASVAGRKITTLEGLAAEYRNAKGSSVPADALHPVQQAWIDEQVPQCGYCQNGWIMYSATLLTLKPNPTDADMFSYFKDLKCRCGTYVQIMAAVRSAAAAM
jgi:aerobic-type carbon monoxide dehydrogenase small subunit (CoxS/CutS family)